jgi:hypothetical protein
MLDFLRGWSMLLFRRSPALAPHNMFLFALSSPFLGALLPSAGGDGMNLANPAPRGKRSGRNG